MYIELQSDKDAGIVVRILNWLDIILIKSTYVDDNGM